MIDEFASEIPVSSPATPTQTRNTPHRNTPTRNNNDNMKTSRDNNAPRNTPSRDTPSSRHAANENRSASPSGTTTTTTTKTRVDAGQNKPQRNFGELFVFVFCSVFMTHISSSRLPLRAIFFFIFYFWISSFLCSHFRHMFFSVLNHNSRALRKVLLQLYTYS